MTSLTPASETQDQPQKNLDGVKTYRQQLLGPDPLPIGHTDRRTALVKLVSMDEPEAHAVVREVLAAFPDPQKATVDTLRTLLSIFITQQVIDLSPEKLADIASDPRTKKRLAIYREHVPELVRVHAALGNIENAAQRENLRNEIQNYLQQLPGEERRPALALIFKDTASPLRAAAIKVAGGTRDPRMAPELAPLLSDPTLRETVQEAIGNLTLRVKTFRDRAEFDEWWKKNADRTYSELAMDAAREARELGARLEADYRAREARLQVRILEGAKRVLELGLSLTPPPWRKLWDELADADLEPHRTQLFELFYGRLVQRKIDRKALQPTISELSGLRDWLEQTWSRSAGDQRAAALSAAAACAWLLGGQAAEEVEARLRDLLGRATASDSVPMPRLFELLALFRTDRVRARVLEVLRRPQAVPHLDSGLRCLRALGLPTGDERLASQTLEWLQQRVRDDQLDVGIRGRALEILGGMGVNDPTVVTALRGLVANPGTLPDNLRATALQLAIVASDAQLQSGGNGNLAAQAHAQLAFLQKCLADAAPRIRLQAARALEKFPEATASFQKDFLSDLAKRIVAASGRALRTERHPGCVKQIRAVLVSQAARASVWEAALTQLARAMCAWTRSENGGNGNEEFLRAQVPPARGDLERLAGGPEIPAAAALQLARDLQQAGLAGAAGVLLASDVLAALDTAAPGAGDPDARKTAEAQRRERAALVMQVVAAAGDYGRLDVQRRQEIDRLLVSSSQGIQAIAADEPLSLIALGRALLASGKSNDAAGVLSLFVTKHAGDASPDQQREARRMLAVAYMNSAQPKDAAALLAGHPDPDSRLLRAQALQQAQEYAAAEKLYSELIQGDSLPAGRDRELALIGHAEVLLLQDKLEELEAALASLPALTDKDAQGRLAVTRSRLQAKREKKTGGAATEKDPAKNGRGQPGGPGKRP